MFGTRQLVLTAGPPILIAGIYALSFPAPRSEPAALEARMVEADSRAERARANEQGVLFQACTKAAEELHFRLPESWMTIVRPPFVLAGNSSVTDLDRLYHDAVAPLSAALWRAYFDRKPDLPVLLILASDSSSYREAARSLDGYEPTAYSGYTQRGDRRLVLDRSTGEGTLAHELAHVLALFDFPEMPEWFDEGLAALQEEATFSNDGLMLIGKHNWRTRLLADALRTNELPSLPSLIRQQSFRGEGENLNYAQVRCFCQYLQERGLLSHYYRKFRAAVRDDPSGLSTLCELLGAANAAEVDRDFRNWVLSRATRTDSQSSAD